MDEWYWVVFAVVAGGIIGVFYFGGLWLTVRALAGARNPGFLILASFVSRTAVALFAFYLLMDGRWQRLLAGMAGFLIARYYMLRRYGNQS
jgi:F1F0 ATPase subunit 2